MKTTHPTLLAALLFLTPLLPLHAADAPKPAAKPSIIYILADDFGLPDIGCYGSAYKTPNLDKLAAAGTHFEYCFAAPLSVGGIGIRASFRQSSSSDG
jgi:hypothetical protein